jgi:UrcA family protein
MTTFTARFAGFATLALAALPVVALSTSAHAADASPQYAHESVQVSDLNMASASGKAAFAQRVDAAARHFCVTEHNLTLKSACQTGVRTEANEKATAAVQFASRS